MTVSDGIAFLEARVRNYRSLKSVDIRMNEATVLVGENNSGKTSFLDALCSAIGAGRRLSITPEDVYLGTGEKAAPKDRIVTVDILVRPVDDNGKVIDAFPQGSPWVALWGQGISQDDNDNDFVAIRTQFRWDPTKDEYTTDRNFLGDWPNTDDWGKAKIKSRASALHISPIAVHYMDAKRDIQSELTTRGSFWHKLVSDPGLSEEDVTRIEEALSELNSGIIDASKVLSHIQTSLGDLDDAVSCERGQLEITPVARNFRDLNRGMDINFATKGAQSFPLARHGMGTRSLASVLTFRAYSTWRQLRRKGNALHPMLAIEEPEAHLHPQAQRALYSLLESLPGQRVFSTHSPHIASQANIADIRHFRKVDSDTRVNEMDVSTLTDDDIRKLNRMVLNTRGDLLFARGIVLFEGETEEQALPILAEEYWGKHPNSLGLTMVGVGGFGNYPPFLRLATSFDIPWFLISDGEPETVKSVTDELNKIGEKLSSPRVCMLPDGHDFEKLLVTIERQQAIIDAIVAIDAENEQHAASLRKKWALEANPREALLEKMRTKGNKTRYATAVASSIIRIPTPADRIPVQIRRLFRHMSEALKIEPSSAYEDCEKQTPVASTSTAPDR